MATGKKLFVAALMAGIMGLTGAFTAPAAAKDIPIQKSFALRMDLGQTTSDILTYAVPEGKRLVIEFTSIVCKFSGTSRVLDALPLASIKTQTGSEVVETYIQLAPSGSVHYEDAQPSDYRYFMGDRKILLFADRGTTVTISFLIQGPFFPEGGDTADCQAVISGYLVKP